MSKPQYYILNGSVLLNAAQAKSFANDPQLDGPYPLHYFYSKEVQNTRITLGYINQRPLIWEGFPKPIKIKLAPEGFRFEYWYVQQDQWWSELTNSPMRVTL